MSTDILRIENHLVHFADGSEREASALEEHLWHLIQTEGRFFFIRQMARMRVTLTTAAHVLSTPLRTRRPQDEAACLQSIWEVLR